MLRLNLISLGLATALTVQNARAQDVLHGSDTCPGDSGGPIFSLDNMQSPENAKSGFGLALRSKNNCFDKPLSLGLGESDRSRRGTVQFRDLNGDGYPDPYSSDTLVLGTPIVERSPVACSLKDGSSPQWLEIRNVFGEWERVAVVFGYAGNEDACYEYVAALNAFAPKRLTRCNPVQC